MTVARSVARSIVRSVASSPIRGGGGVPALDADALDYFSRAEGLGGSFDLANQIGAYDSDFSAGVDGWAAIAGTTIAGNIDDIGGRNDCLRLGTGTSDAVKYVSQVLLTVGVNNIVSLDIFIPSTNAQVDGVRLWETTSGLTQVLTPTQDQWQSFTVSGVPGSTTLRIQAVDGVATTITADNDLIYIRNVRIRQTSVATFTEAYVKTAISDFIAGCKTDLIWAKLTEVYLLAGVTFGGLMAKLKHAGTATLENAGGLFVTGDYLAAGSGAGLVGNGSTKYLTTGFASNLLGQNDVGISTYATARHSASGTSSWISDAASGAQTAIGCIGTTGVTFSRMRESSTTETGITVGFKLASRIINTQFSYYENGGAAVVKAFASNTPSVNAFAIHARDATGAGPSNARLTFAHIGTGLTNTDALNLSNRVNALMTAIGANVY